MATPNSRATNATWLGLSPFFTSCTCPFLSIFMISYPCNVLCAVSNEKKPIPGFTSRLIKRLTRIRDGLFLCSDSVANPQGFELMNRIRKGQAQGVGKGDVRGQI